LKIFPRGPKSQENHEGFARQVLGLQRLAHVPGGARAIGVSGVQGRAVEQAIQCERLLQERSLQGAERIGIGRRL
jgi:hypothetical protein